MCHLDTPSEHSTRNSRLTITPPIVLSTPRRGHAIARIANKNNGDFVSRRLEHRLRLEEAHISSSRVRTQTNGRSARIVRGLTSRHATTTTTITAYCYHHESSFHRIALVRELEEHLLQGSLTKAILLYVQLELGCKQTHRILVEKFVLHVRLAMSPKFLSEVSLASSPLSLSLSLLSFTSHQVQRPKKNSQST